MAERITDQLVRRLEAPARGNRITYDTDIKGFGARITAKGARSFVLNYWHHGTERRLTIGAYPAWSVEAARRRASELRRQVDRGEDPLSAREEERRAPTVADLWECYTVLHLPGKAPRAQADDRAMFRDYILPALGGMKVSAVRHGDVDALHRQISLKGKVRANRVVEVLRKAFALAVRQGWRPDNPASGVRRNPEEKRTRYLSPAEIVRLVEALDRHPERASAEAIRLLLLTGARRGEVLAATWAQFDLERGVWTKPSAHTKQRKEHRVPLSAPALALLRRLREEATDSPFVFPGRNGNALTDVKRTWAAVCEAAELVDVRLHDLRHTYASILASEGLSLPIIGALLGHTQAQTTARYAHLLDDPLRAATERVGAAVLNGKGRDSPERQQSS